MYNVILCVVYVSAFIFYSCVFYSHLVLLVLYCPIQEEQRVVVGLGNVHFISMGYCLVSSAAAMLVRQCSMVTATATALQQRCCRYCCI